jgi:non-heme chloroperoxidase
MNRRDAFGFGTAAMALGLAVNTTHSAAAARIPQRVGPYIERPDGTSLFFKDWGTGDAVVFVHSAGNSSDVWAYSMIHVVKQGFRCVAFDRRGHGRSSVSGGGYDYDTLADDLAGVMDAFDLRSATLVGHSMGCGELVRYLTRHGSKRVARIALVAPTLPFLLKTPDNPSGIDKKYFDAMRAEWAHDYPKWLSAHSAPFFTPDPSPEMIQWGIGLALQTSLHAAIESNISVTETDFREELKKIDVPTMIVHGNADKSAPLEMTGRPTAKLIPGSELKIYEGAPHGVLLTHVEQLNEDLMSFVRTQWIEPALPRGRPQDGNKERFKLGP